MICKKCGANNNETTKFCTQCGSPLESSKEKKSALGTVSLVIGVIAVILSFILNVFMIPLAITGIVVGACCKEKTKKKVVGIILNSVSIFISLVMVFIILVVLGIYSTSKLMEESRDALADQYLLGTWDCKSYNGEEPGEDFIVTMKLNSDQSFVWNKYQDEENNHVYGTFTYEEEPEKSKGSDALYYMIDLDGEEFVNNGVKQQEKYHSEYEIAVQVLERDAVMINPSTYNMYYCIKTSYE